MSFFGFCLHCVHCHILYFTSGVDRPHYFGSGDGTFATLAHVYDPETRSHKPVVRKIGNLPVRDAVDIGNLIREEYPGIEVEGMSHAASVMLCKSSFIGEFAAEGT